MDTEKKPRQRKTDAERLKEFDDAIDKSEARTEKLRRDRLAFLQSVQKKRDEMDAILSGGQQ